MFMRTEAQQLGSPIASRSDRRLATERQTFRIAQNRSNSVLVALVVVTLGLIPAAERAHADGGIRPQARSTQPPEAAQAEALLRQIYEEGQQALTEDRLVDAESAFHRVLVMDPKNAGAYTNLGVIAMRRKQWAAALRNLKQGERLAPGVPGVRLNIGLTYYSLGEYKAAAEAFESVLRDDPASAQARYLLGMCYFFTRQYAGTVEQLEPLWDAQSRNFSYLYVLAVAADEAGRRETEERAARQLVEVGENKAELHLLFGKADLQSLKNDDALGELKQAAHLNPRLPFVHFYLGIAYRRHNEFEEAKTEFLEDLKIDPEIAYTYDELGAVCHYLQQTNESEMYYRKAIQINSRLASSFYGLAQVSIARRKYEQALRWLANAQALDPQSASVHFLKAKALEGLGRHDDAKREYAVVARMQKAVRDDLERHVSGAEIPNPDLGEH
jgi:tetratricopeptide (TPR) repeat protein